MKVCIYLLRYYNTLQKKLMRDIVRDELNLIIQERRFLEGMTPEDYIERQKFMIERLDDSKLLRAPSDTIAEENERIKKELLYFNSYENFKTELLSRLEKNWKNVLSQVVPLYRIWGMKYFINEDKIFLCNASYLSVQVSSDLSKNLIGDGRKFIPVEEFLNLLEDEEEYPEGLPKKEVLANMVKITETSFIVAHAGKITEEHANDLVQFEL